MSDEIFARRFGRSDGHERPLQKRSQPVVPRDREKLKAFVARPLEVDWPYLWIDATYLKVRHSGRVLSVAVIVAVGVNSDGRHEVPGMDIGPSEAETFGLNSCASSLDVVCGRQAGDIRCPWGN